LRDEFRELVDQADRVVDLNAIRDHHSQTTKVDIVGDATDMTPFANERFDFVCSSHLLEHLSDPLRAIEKWKSVLRPGGVIYCGVPNRFTIFDHRRRATSLEHLLSDYLRDIGPNDWSHLEEFLAKWDHRLDSVWNTREELAQEVAKRGSNAIHHHVWNQRNLRGLFSLAGFETVYIATKGRTIHAIARMHPDQTERSS
jgi:SAM-dependent methyltransferase